MNNRCYQRTYYVGRVVMQIMLLDLSDNFTMHLLPQITISSNRMCIAAVGIEWIFGEWNFGVCRKSYRDGLIQREQDIHALALKNGLTDKQQRLRWGW